MDIEIIGHGSTHATNQLPQCPLMTLVPFLLLFLLLYLFTTLPSSFVFILSLHPLSLLSPSILWLASIHCPNLQSLAYCSDEFPPSSNSLWSLANGCRRLRHLNLPPVLGSPHADCFNDGCLMIIAHAWPSLLSLTIGGSAISAQGLVDIGMWPK